MRTSLLSAEDIARRREIAAALLRTPEGRELLAATRSLQSWPVVERRVGTSAEGQIVVRALAPAPPGEPSPGERLRAAGRAAERRAESLGTLPGDWFAVAMIVSSAARSGWICVGCLRGVTCEQKSLAGVGAVVCRECGEEVPRERARYCDAGDDCEVCDGARRVSIRDDEVFRICGRCDGDGAVEIDGEGDGATR